jgi:hypothetical protein
MIGGNSSFDLGHQRDLSPGLRNDMINLAKSIADKNKEVNIILGGYG